MNITTTFSCGDKGWVYWGDSGVRQLTIGQVQMTVIDSPGNGGDTFSNYGPQQGRKETCMCIETGVGSGSVYTVGESIFTEKADCVAANAANIAECERRVAEKKRREREHLLRQEESLRRQLAKIEAIKAEAS